MAKMKLEQTPDELAAALADPNMPKIYSNGFSCMLGLGDIAVLFKIAQQPTAVVNLSYTTAKTLAVKLNELVSYLESKSDHTIMTTDEIKVYLTKEE